MTKTQTKIIENLKNQKKKLEDELDNLYDLLERGHRVPYEDTAHLKIKIEVWNDAIKVASETCL